MMQIPLLLQTGVDPSFDGQIICTFVALTNVLSTCSSAYDVVLGPTYSKRQRTRWWCLYMSCSSTRQRISHQCFANASFSSGNLRVELDAHSICDVDTERSYLVSRILFAPRPLVISLLDRLLERVDRLGQISQLLPDRRQPFP